MSMSPGWEHRQHVLELMRGYRTAQVLIACAELGVFEALHDGALGAQELGERLGAHAPSLARLLRAAVALGLLHQQEAGYANSPLADACLATEGPLNEALRAGSPRAR